MLKHLLITLGFCFLLSDARPSSSLNDVPANTEKRQANNVDLQDKRSQNHYLKKRSEKKTFTKEEIDRKKVDPNSSLELLLESMSDDGHNAIGIHPKQKASIKAMKLEEKESKEEVEKKKNNAKRNFVPQFDSGFDRYWVNATIPFYINLDDFEDKENVAKTIKEAKDDFEAKTCVKIIQKTVEELESEQIEWYVNITNSLGCYSNVGVSEEDRNKGQLLHLQEQGCMIKSTVIHEFCHALGMEHEQSRTDRDQYVKIYQDRVLKEYKWVYEKDQITLDRNPYDYASLMQYRLDGFAKTNWENVMEFRDPNLEFLADSSTELTFYDVMDITKAYKCSEKCSKPVIACKNRGFLDHQCNCYCPEGLKGDDCNTIASDDCGGIIDLVPGKEVQITSPNYPNSYDVGKICYWLLRAQNINQTVMVKIQDFDLPSNKDLFRCYHWLEIRYNLVGQPGRKYCDDRFYTDKISSSSFGNPDLMMLIFDTATVTGVDAKKGFSLTAEAFDVNPTGCGEPPIIENSSDDFDEMGSSIGAIIRYDCNYGYQMVGYGSVTCEADGTWSPIRFNCKRRIPIFECDFENGACGVTYNSDDPEYKWKIGNITFTEIDVNGAETLRTNSFFAVLPYTANKSTYANFYIERSIRTDIAYCLSFYFFRNSDNDKCASIQVGDKFYSRWTYSECVESEQWELFQGNFGPYDDLKVTNEILDWISFAATVSDKNGGEFNVYIDDIILSEGPC